MLDDGDVSPQKNRVGGARAVARVVYIVGVYADQSRAPVGQKLRRRARQKRMALEILLAPPMRVPARLNQYRLALEINFAKVISVNHSVWRVARSDTDAVQVCDARERQLREIATVAVPMIG